MTRDDVVRMAQEAGFAHAPPKFKHWRGTISDLERFAALVVAAEREVVARQAAIPVVITWCGKPVEELAIGELREVVQSCADENRTLRRMAGYTA